MYIVYYILLAKFQIYSQYTVFYGFVMYLQVK